MSLFLSDVALLSGNKVLFLLKKELIMKKKMVKAVPKKAGRKVSKADKLSGERYHGGLLAIIGVLDGLVKSFKSLEKVNGSLAGKERLRLFGSGVKNYGFIEKARDLVCDNPEFAPPFLSAERMSANIGQLDLMRQITFVLEDFLAMANNVLLLNSDRCFRDALSVYRYFREQVRSRVPGSRPLFEALSSFFAKRRRKGSEPTARQVKRDVSSLLRGKSSGRVVVENERPRVVGGARKMVN
jgi:hypothetical protein